MKYNIYKSKKKKNKKQRKSFLSISLFKKTKKNSSKSQSKIFLSDNIIDENPTYVDGYTNRRSKNWIFHSLAVLLILGTVFWLGPKAVNTINKYFQGEKRPENKIELIYSSENYAVVNVRTADILDLPDIRGSRISQALFNDVVKIIDFENTGFLHIETSDGFKGYILRENISFDLNAVEPNKYKHKLTVVSTTKRIMSHASSGSIKQEVVMGTVLFSDYSSEGLYRVALQNDDHGWISSEGVIRTDIDKSPSVSNSSKFYETTMFFANITYVPNGITIYGASSSGIAYVCAAVNGVNIPRDISGQIKSGVKVPVSYDKDTSIPIFEDIKEGDLIFFGKDNENIDDMGIIVGHGKVLKTGRIRNSIKIINILDDQTLYNSILEVRRIFTES